MTIQEMHIGIDLGLQAINSNVFGKLLKEEKDYYINLVTKELVTLALTEEKNTVYDVATYGDIRSYYERLQEYIITAELGYEESLGEGYVYSKLPTSMYSLSVNSGLLYHGATYKVLTAGTTDLSSFGYKTIPVAGESFKCNLPIQSGTGATLITGETYKIINSGGIEWTTYGATSNNCGTVFKYETVGNIVIYDGVDIQLQNITDTPGWTSAGDATDLTVIEDIGYFLNIVSRSSISTGSPLTGKTLDLGSKYVILTKGSTPTDFSGYGGIANPDVGYIFTCTVLSGIALIGNTIYYKVDDNANRLVKAQDIYDFLNNSFGSVKTSPISIFSSKGLRVYHNNKFNIYRLFLDYIRIPISVNYEKSIDSDLPISVHSFLIDLVVKRISAYSGNPTYSAQVNEIKDKG